MAATRARRMATSAESQLPVPAAEATGELPAPREQRYFNRELSWLAFNRRVLEEACNAHHPLLERLRFLSISASNLDEFFMVRVAGLKAHQALGVEERSADGMTTGAAASRDRSGGRPAGRKPGRSLARAFATRLPAVDVIMVGDEAARPEGRKLARLPISASRSSRF